MKITPTVLSEVLLIEPDVFGDERGYFCESWQKKRYADMGLDVDFVQDNLSFSQHNILRGLHVQHPFSQGKLVYVLQGEVFDVAVDIRPDSPDFGRWVGVTLSADNRQQLYIPPGFAHGFCVTGETALFVYKCTELYHPETELSIAWDDPNIGIEWPLQQPSLSQKDQAGLLLNDIPKARLPTKG
ncbi:MAG: dTDP-4-dehydrorhamnose 3,5-epimerase [Methylococcaceae bacterium]|nr:dTDP-4-dehydrorhamnose 3,5-epimerase [Methylococcaceae bacterium]